MGLCTCRFLEGCDINASYQRLIIEEGNHHLQSVPLSPGNREHAEHWEQEHTDAATFSFLSLLLLQSPTLLSS